MRAGFLGLGIFIPKAILTNKDLEKRKGFDTSDEWITQRTGIKKRHIANDICVSEMGTIASKEAIKDAGVDKKKLILLFVLLDLFTLGYLLLKFREI